MSNAIFPTLPGLKWGVSKAPKWHTIIHRSASQRRYAATSVSAPVWGFKLQYEFLRQGNGFNELSQLVGFFNLRKGAWDTFLYLDPNENAVVDQVVIASTVAGRTRYKLNKTYGGFTEGIGACNGAPVIKLDGATVSPSLYTIDDNGYVEFNTAPTAGQVLSWTGGFYYRVAFEKDETEYDEFLKGLFESRKIEFESVKL